MITNKVAHLFIIHVLNNLDDTVISKKQLINDILVTIDDNKNDECFARIFMGIFCPKSKRFFTKDDLEAFEIYSDHNTSKKDPAQRRLELIGGCLKPLETFYEENMLWYLLDTVKSPLLS